MDANAEALAKSLGVDIEVLRDKLTRLADGTPAFGDDITPAEVQFLRDCLDVACGL